MTAPNASPSNVLTTQQVAVRLAVTPGRVRQLAQAHGIGTKLTDRMRVFSEADVERLRRARKPAGRPKTT